MTDINDIPFDQSSKLELNLSMGDDAESANERVSSLSLWSVFFISLGFLIVQSFLMDSWPISFLVIAYSLMASIGIIIALIGIETEDENQARRITQIQTNGSEIYDQQDVKAKLESLGILVEPHSEITDSSWTKSFKRLVERTWLILICTQQGRLVHQGILFIFISMIAGALIIQHLGITGQTVYEITQDIFPIAAILWFLVFLIGFLFGWYSYNWKSREYQAVSGKRHYTIKAIIIPAVFLVFVGIAQASPTKIFPLEWFRAYPHTGLAMALLPFPIYYGAVASGSWMRQWIISRVSRFGGIQAYTIKKPENLPRMAKIIWTYRDLRFNGKIFKAYLLYNFIILPWRIFGRTPNKERNPMLFKQYKKMIVGRLRAKEKWSHILKELSEFGPRNSFSGSLFGLRVEALINSGNISMAKENIEERLNYCGYPHRAKPPGIHVGYILHYRSIIDWLESRYSNDRVSRRKLEHAIKRANIACSYFDSCALLNNNRAYFLFLALAQYSQSGVQDKKMIEEAKDALLRAWKILGSRSIRNAYNPAFLYPYSCMADTAGCLAIIEGDWESAHEWFWKAFLDIRNPYPYFHLALWYASKPGKQDLNRAEILVRQSLKYASNRPFFSELVALAEDLMGCITLAMQYELRFKPSFFIRMHFPIMKPSRLDVVSEPLYKDTNSLGRQDADREDTQEWIFDRLSGRRQIDKAA